MSTSTPRVTASYLEQFSNQTVRILGKVVQLRGESATIDAGGSISVQLNRDCHLQPGHAVEIVGKVQGDLSIKVLASTDFGTSIAYEAVVDATHRYKKIFYGE